ncbi:MAG: hypothetical protein Q9157_007698, partial [Trypethelium eluteriae]
MTFGRAESSKIAASSSPKINSPIPNVVKNDPLSGILARKESSSTESSTLKEDIDRIDSVMSDEKARKDGNVGALESKRTPPKGIQNKLVDLPPATYVVRMTIQDKRRAR